jgi:predicted nucleotide-binding protein (sugar kinase/HSP70/actin superfamily)
MGDKPFLQIEIDEHSADAGIITRCEAFLDSIASRKEYREKAKKISSGQLSFQSIPEKKHAQKGSAAIKENHVSGKLKKRVVYIPRMCDHTISLAAAFESCGVDAVVMDVPDIDTVKTGRRFVSGKECYPCLITTGDMVKKAQSYGFDPERAVFFMPSGSGPCRFGQYNILHRFVLDKLGFQNVPIFAPNQDTSLYNELGIVGNEFTRQAWKGIIATELLMKCLHESRPYEKTKGETDALYKQYLSEISTTIKNQNGNFDTLLQEIREAFIRIPKLSEKKPIIGIIGEIFVRHNAFSNENIIRKIESLGGEVWLAPFEEWMYYINAMALRRSKSHWKQNPFSSRHLQDIFSILTTRYFQRKIEHKFSHHFEGFLKTLREPSTDEILQNASAYLHNTFEGEAVLSVGKAIDYVKVGASGIINVMPFGCMPGTIVSALLKGVKQDTGIPFLSIAYDGTEATASEIQLEAFIHQALEYRRNKDAVGKT